MRQLTSEFLGRIIAPLVLLVAVPVFFVALSVGLLVVRVLTDTRNVPRIALSVVAAGVAAALVTSIGVALTLPRCPPMLVGNGVSLTHRQLRWVGLRLGIYTVELPLSSIR
jgi:hypothetical protein